MRYSFFSLVVAINAVAGFDVQAANTDRETFQVIFGVRAALSAQHGYGVTDSVKYIVEAPNGDIVVAGNGASSYTDTGSRTKPMVARIDPSGNVLWRQIYEDLENQEILAFAGKGDGQFIVFKKRVEDRSGRTRRTETLSLRRVDSDGNMSRELGGIDGVQVYGTAAVVNAELERLVFAGIDAEGTPSPRPEIRDVRLHEIDLNGNVRRLAFPEGIKGLRMFQHVGNDNFVFLRMGSFYSEPQDIARVNADGEVDQVIEWYDEVKMPSHVLATASRIFLIYQIDYREKKYRVLAHSIDGSGHWHYDIEGVDRVVAATATRTGGLILSGNYEGNPLVIAVSPQGEFQWSHRFRSAKANAGIAAISELSDGWLALAGSTSPGNAAFSSTDADALLVVSGPAGAGLSDYSGCLADADEIERLRAELQSLTGMEVRREVLMSGRKPTPVEDLPHLNAKVPPTGDCGSLSEQDLKRFLRESVDEAHVLNLSKPSDRAKIDVMLRPTGSLHPTGFKETGRFDVGRTPRLEVEHRSGREAMRYIAEEILPYTERFWVVFDQLQAAGRMWVGDKSRGLGLPAGPTFSKVTVLAEQFVETLNEQPEQDRRAFTAKFSAKPIVFSADDDFLHLWGDSWLIVGKNRIDDIFEYVLKTLPEIESGILAETKALYSAVATQFRKSDPNLPRAKYLEVLRRVSASIESLSDEDIAVLRDTFASVEVGNRYINDLGLQDYRRLVYMETVAAEHVLSFIVENAEELQSQELRP
jgi:hypothetical protein